MKIPPCPSTHFPSAAIMVSIWMSLSSVSRMSCQNSSPHKSRCLWSHRNGQPMKSCVLFSLLPHSSKFSSKCLTSRAECGVNTSLIPELKAEQENHMHKIRLEFPFGHSFNNNNSNQTTTTTTLTATPKPNPNQTTKKQGGAGMQLRWHSACLVLGSIPSTTESWRGGCTPVISALERWGWEDQKYHSVVGYIVSLRSVLDTVRPCLKGKNRKK